MVKSTTIFTLLTSTVFALHPDPVGQKAHYKLDKDPARTSSMIKSGTMDVLVTKLIAGAEPPAYELQLDYHFNVQFVGTQQGSKMTPIDAEYFTPEFLENLRKTGVFTGPNFKAKHLGFADAKNLDGKVYPNCDKILLYDIHQQASVDFILHALFGVERPEIENVEVLGHIYPGVPVLGAVKIDVSGTCQGMRLKAGGDFMP